MIDDYDESSGWMFLLVPAHPGFPGQIPQSRKTVVCVCVFEVYVWFTSHFILLQPILVSVFHCVHVAFCLSDLVLGLFFLHWPLDVCLLQERLQATSACHSAVSATDDDGASSSWLSWLFSCICHTTWLHAYTAITPSTIFSIIFVKKMSCDTVNHWCVCFRLIKMINFSIANFFVFKGLDIATWIWDFCWV